jgi:hypothetical protein
MGYEVYKPVTATARNDIVIEIGDCFYRVQVKSVRRRKHGRLVNNHEWKLDGRNYDILANVVLPEHSVTFEPPLETLTARRTAA